MFKLNNTGTVTATDVRVTIIFSQGPQIRNEIWSLPGESSTIEPGETVDVFFMLDVKPTELAVTIVVQCDEGVSQEFVEFLPP